MLSADEQNQRAVIQCLLLSPRTLNELAAQVKSIELKDLQRALVQLREQGLTACTAKRWWLRGIGLADLHKAQDKENDRKCR